MSGGGNEPRSTNRMPAGAGKSIPAAASFPTGGDARRRDLRLFAFLACLRAALSDSGVEGAPRPPTAAASTAPTAEASATVAVAPAAPLGGALPRPGRVLPQMPDDPAGLSSELFGARLASWRRKGSISSSDCRCRFIRAPIPSTSIPSIGTTNAIARNSSGLMRATPASRAPCKIGCDCEPQSLPPSWTSCFQIGTVALSVSMPKRAASNASPRCGADTATTTELSASSSVPTRCSSATFTIVGHRRRISATISPNRGTTCSS